MQDGMQLNYQLNGELGIKITVFVSMIFTQKHNVCKLHKQLCPGEYFLDVLYFSMQYSLCSLKTWFLYVGKIQDDRGFYFCLTVPDFADISGNRQKSDRFSRDTMLYV